MLNGGGLMSAKATEVWAQIGIKYVKAGYPNHRLWIFSPGQEDRAAFAELQARGHIRSMGLAEKFWRITDNGIGEILMRIAMTPEADAALETLGKEYAQAGYPDHRSWSFGSGEKEKQVFPELWARGFIEPQVTGARAWRFTDGGVQHVLRTQAAGPGLREPWPCSGP
jgi:hypothetical protein